MLIKDIDFNKKQFFILFPEYDFWNNYFIETKRLVSFQDIIDSFDIPDDYMKNYKSLDELDSDYCVYFFIVWDSMIYNPVSWYIIEQNVYPFENKYPINKEDFIDFINDRYLKDDLYYK